MSKATIKDVAKLANVSISSVSNVINGINKCSEETRLKILDAMDQLEYKPNLAAKSLVQKKSNLIGVVFKEENDNSYEKIVKGIEKQIRANGEYDFLTMTYQSMSLVEDWIQKRNLDGLIFIGDFSNNFLSYLQKMKEHIVCIDNYNEQISGIVYINSEDTLGGYLATEALLKAGVTEPFILSIKLENSELANRRYLGYLSCLEEYGIEYKENMLIEVPKEDFLEGKLVGATLQSRGIKGLVCTEDILALGVLKTLYNFEISCPKEIKIIGFDNIKGSEYTNPSLTTVETGSERKGEKAGELLLKLVDKIEIKKFEYNIDAKLIKRETL